MEARVEALGDAIGGNVTEAPGHWIVHDVVAAREGVNGRGEFKPWEELRKAADTLEGAPLIYGTPSRGHPVDPSDGGVLVDVDPLDAVGIAVNVRADEARKRLVYDALLYRAPPQGSRAGDDIAAKNPQLVRIVRQGQAVDNSVGYGLRERPAYGTYRGDDGEVVYTAVQERLRFGHVAILYPMSPQRGACSTHMGCGMNAGDSDEGGCTGGEGCCKKRTEAAVQAIVATHGISRGGALRALRDGASGLRNPQRAT